jgi:sigma-B regulation protein RsbU (phosphoserine phosphatase)
MDTDKELSFMRLEIVESFEEIFRILSKVQDSLSFLKSCPAAIEKISKASRSAKDFPRLNLNRFETLQYPAFRVLTLLDQAIQLFDEGCIHAAGEDMVLAIDKARSIIMRVGRFCSNEGSMTKIGIGEILPPARLGQPVPGKVLLALEKESSKHTSSLLRKYGHDIVVAHSLEDIAKAFGYFPMLGPAQCPGTGHFRLAIEGRLVEFFKMDQELESPDVVVGDLFSSNCVGFELLDLVRIHTQSNDTRMIIVSPFTDSECVARAIQRGADDFLGWAVEPSVLVARIESSIERKRLRARSGLLIAQLAHARATLDEELSKGAEYVRCLLPEKLLSQRLSTDWVFIPSLRLGGDLFGYHGLDDGRMAFFMLDVSGHGVKSALYSVTIFETLKGSMLRDIDYGDPVSVTSELNKAFRMEDHDSMLFTLWYGVWDETTRTLTHASAGSPPAVLTVRGGGAIELKAEGVIGGADPDSVYKKLEIQVPRQSRLFLFSDGIYEVMAKSGRILGLNAFIQTLERSASEAKDGESSTAAIMASLVALSGSKQFQDDVTLLEVRFD